jgi:hypothetical protein
MDLELIDMFPHDHPLLDEETELMSEQAKAMEEKLDEYIKSPFKTEFRIPEHVDAQGVIVDEKKV